MTAYTVLISLNGGTNWAKIPEPVSATSPEAAAEKVRQTHDDLRGNEDALFYPVPASRFQPISKRKQLVETWKWGKAKVPAQGKLDTGGES